MKIIEAKIDEEIKIKPRYGYALDIHFGDLRPGDLFYCTGIGKYTATFEKQNDRSYSIQVPIAFAEQAFTDVSMLKRGKLYTLKADIPYILLDNAYDMDWSPKFIQKYTGTYQGESWIVFPKGTRFKYIGSDMSGDEFTVDGEYVGIVDVTEVEDTKGKSFNSYAQLFK